MLLSSPIEVHVMLEPSETIRRYRDELRALRMELERVSALYRQEVVVNQRLVDLLRVHGISWRQ